MLFFTPVVLQVFQVRNPVLYSTERTEHGRILDNAELAQRANGRFQLVYFADIAVLLAL